MLFAQDGITFSSGQIIALVLGMAGAITSIFWLLIGEYRETLKRVRKDRDDYREICLEAVHIVRYLEHQVAILQGRIPTTEPAPLRHDDVEQAEGTADSMRRVLKSVAKKAGMPPKDKTEP